MGKKCWVITVLCRENWFNLLGNLCAGKLFQNNHLFFKGKASFTNFTEIALSYLTDLKSV